MLKLIDLKGFSYHWGRILHHTKVANLLYNWILYFLIMCYLDTPLWVTDMYWMKDLVTCSVFIAWKNEVLKTVKMLIVVCWVVTPCNHMCFLIYIPFLFLLCWYMAVTFDV